MIDFAEMVVGQFRELREELAHAGMRNEALAYRLDNMMRPGKVTEVDTKKQLYRQEIAEQDGKIVKSPWMPYAQVAGEYKSHTPPTVGQQMWMFAPNGDPRQAIGVPMTWSNENKSPSDKPDDHVHTYGEKFRLREKKDLRQFTLDKVQQTIKPDTIKTSINGGNTPKDGNGSRADDEAENDQEASGSSILQEEKKITSRTPGVTVTHDEKSYDVSAEDEIVISANNKVTIVVGGANMVVEDGKITLTATQIFTDGMTILGSPEAVARVILETGPATKVLGI